MSGVGRGKKGQSKSFRLNQVRGHTDRINSALFVKKGKYGFWGCLFVDYRKSARMNRKMPRRITTFLMIRVLFPVPFS